MEEPAVNQECIAVISQYTHFKDGVQKGKYGKAAQLYVTKENDLGFQITCL